MFKAHLLEEADGKVTGRLAELDESQIPQEGEVMVDVHFSTLNYKDGMVLNGLGRLVRSYPHVAGVDYAGKVLQSSHPDWKPGDDVILTGWRVGEWHWGGYAQKARAKAGWLVPLPKGLSLKQAMAIGTAGFTAMLAVMALEKHGLTPESGEVLVTGAAGGVGSVATALLAKAGFHVAAVTGRPEQEAYLKDLGAELIVPRSELADAPTRPLDKERWAGAVDSVGGTMLARLLTQMKYRSAVASVGLAGGNQLNTTVLPFLLRGVSILGIDSVMSPKEERLEAWQRIARDLPLAKLDAMTTTASLGDLPRLGKAILKGELRGRTVIDLKA
ncbi:MAG TPA: MDR family oxidoreductase [Kiloniellales bacterium]|nr:MDR family oxidoreductase [Kiloniellales bacterium]